MTMDNETPIKKRGRPRLLTDEERAAGPSRYYGRYKEYQRARGSNYIRLRNEERDRLAKKDNAKSANIIT